MRGYCIYFFFLEIIYPMKLILHSDHVENNTIIDVEWIKYFQGKSIKMGYIPSETSCWLEDYDIKVQRYNQFWITNILYFDINQSYTHDKLEQLLLCDAIFLDWWHVRNFLKSMKSTNFVSIIKNYVNNGGILIWLSAWAILMSETIDIINVKNPDKWDLKDQNSIGLIDFEFFPHLNRYDEEDWEWQYDIILEKLNTYSLTNNNKSIYVCNDWDWIIVENNELKFYWKILKIQNGKISFIWE